MTPYTTADVSMVIPSPPTTDDNFVGFGSLQINRMKNTVDENDNKTEATIDAAKANISETAQFVARAVFIVGMACSHK
jgi:hypothetical protein